MNELSIARRYAKAIFELAVDENRYDEMGAELSAAAKALESDEALMEALRDPATTREAKLELAGALVSAYGLGATAANSLKLLAERNRLVMLPLVAQAYAALADEKAGRVKAQLVSAVPLSEEAATRIAAQLTRATRRNVIVERAVDPAILGGVVARVGGKTFDGSLRTQLEGLKKQLKA